MNSNKYLLKLNLFIESFTIFTSRAEIFSASMEFILYGYFFGKQKGVASCYISFTDYGNCIIYFQESKDLIGTKKLLLSN